MKKFAVILVTIAGVLLIGCQTVERQSLKPIYDQSHAVLVERTIAGLPIDSLISSHVNKKETIIVASIEEVVNDDFHINYLIEDNLISILTKNGYRVLERDEDMIVRLMPEQNETYDRKSLRTPPPDPSIVMLDSFAKYGINLLTTFPSFLIPTEDSADSSVILEIDPEWILELYDDLQDDFEKIQSEMKMTSADVILAYRILECGIVYDIDRRKEKKLNPLTGKPVNSGKELWTHSFGREALTRLSIRLIDAKTGEIRIADSLMSEDNDIVTFQQTEGETEAAYIKRISEYEELLSRYHFTFYDHQLPARTTNPETPIDKGQDLTPDISTASHRSAVIWRTILFPGLGNYYTGYVGQGVLHNFLHISSLVGAIVGGIFTDGFAAIPSGIVWLGNAIWSGVSALNQTATME